MPLAADDGTIYLALEGVARTNSLAMVHAENRQIARALGARQRAAGTQDLAAWEAASPGFVEASEIRKMGALCRRLGCRLYVVHLTSREGLEAVRDLRAEGTRVIAETCPQYLTHTWQEDPSNLRLKHTPPLRSHEDTAALWQALADDEIQCVGTDHIPNYLEEKLGGDDLWQALSGSAEIETLLPVLLHHGVRQGRISLPRLVEVTSLNAAHAFAVYPRKGHLAVGADADLTLVDLDLTRVVRLAEMESAAETDYCTYEGQELTGWPTLTMLRGKVIARNGAAVGPPSGRYLDRSTSPATRS
jgi:dihydroorotase-like cyclic amidohydrolase